MLDGRQPTLLEQAKGAIHDHAQASSFPTGADLDRIKAFELTNEFFSSPETRTFAAGGAAPGLPRGNTASEKRGRRFFEDELDFVDLKHGLCAGRHAGPMLNETKPSTLLSLHRAPSVRRRSGWHGGDARRPQSGCAGVRPQSGHTGRTSPVQS
jgi:cytochrome c peroxidase